MDEPEPDPPAGAQTTDQPDVPDLEGDGGGDDGSDGDVGGGSSGVSIPTPDLSRRQTLVIAAIIVVVIAAIVASRRDDSGGGGGSIEELREADLESGEASDEEGERVIKVPQDPDEPLKGDEAVLEALRERGKVSGGDDDGGD